MRGRHKRWLAAFGIAVALAAIFWIFKDTLLDITYLQDFIESMGVYGIAGFIVFYIAAILLVLPISGLNILAGVVFSPFIGSVAVIIAGTIGAQLSFSFSRYVYAHKRSHGSNIEQMAKRMEEKLTEHTFWYLCTLRMLQVHFSLLSYAAGTLPSITTSQFFWSTFLTNCIISPIIVALGAIAAREPLVLLLPGTVVLAIVAGVLLVKKITATLR
jgi:uncharacterized membrane protein YdjX (TVP38/TMEM64 family)